MVQSFCIQNYNFLTFEKVISFKISGFRMKKIAFFGATGMLGKPVLREFIKRGYAVTALTRDLEKASELFPEKVNWVQGDLTQYEIVDEIIKKSDIIYCNLSIAPGSRENDFQPEREGLSSILRSAKWNDTSRILYVSSIARLYYGMNGYNWWGLEMKNQAVDKIKRSGIPYIIFNPSTFMENYTEGGFVQNQKLMVVGNSKFPNWLIAADDFAKMAVNSIEVVHEDDNKEMIIQGPEGFKLDKAASFFSSNYSKAKLSVSKVPLSVTKALGLFDRKYEYYAYMMEAINNYPETFQSDEVWQEIGKPQITFKEFIQSGGKPVKVKVENSETKSE